MQEPTYEQHGKRKFWSLPDLEWLEDQYTTQNKDAKQIANEIGAVGSTVGTWLDALNIPVRTRAERGMEHSVGPKAQKKECQRVGKPCVCAWCGVEGDNIPGRHEVSTPTCSLDLHHKNHIRKDGKLSNLAYLCPKCHKLETALWHIRKFKKAKVTVTNKIITIDFNI